MSGLKDFSPDQRSKNPYHHIDPGFINYRKCLSAFGSAFVDAFDSRKRPESDHWAKLFNDHLFVDMVLAECRRRKVRSLAEVLQNLLVGEIFSSTEKLEGTEDVYGRSRAVNRVLLPYEYEKDVVLEFGTSHFVADTGKVEQSHECIVSIIGQLRGLEADRILLSPCIMGAPSLDHPLNREIGIPAEQLIWYGFDWFETLPEDIDEFRDAQKVSLPDASDWIPYMKSAAEATIKMKVAEWLGDATKKDWGGEQADHFTSSVHLSGRRTTAAFVLKGPAQFREMTPDMLGKRADQIYRLAGTPARLLIVQHCHDIGPAVRAMLRAFAVTPHDPRRYCLMDGKSTYRILKAYAKL